MRFIAPLLAIVIELLRYVGVDSAAERAAQKTAMSHLQLAQEALTRGNPGKRPQSFEQARRTLSDPDNALWGFGAIAAPELMGWWTEFEGGREIEPAAYAQQAQAAQLIADRGHSRAGVLAEIGRQIEQAEDWSPVVTLKLLSDW